MRQELAMSDEELVQNEESASSTSSTSSPKIDVITYGCSAHLLNLLSRDLEFPGIKGHVVEIVKYFRNVHFASATYKMEGGKGLVLPQDVRWNTLADCLEAFLKNWPVMFKICEEHRDKIDKEIANKVHNIGLKRNAEEYLTLMKPISVALDKMQRNKCNISEGTEIWIKLYSDLKDGNSSQESLKKAQNHMKMALTPAHYLANILNPKYRGQSLKSSEVNSVLEYANENYNSCMPTIINYRAMCSPFSSIMFSENITQNVTPLAWWLSVSDQLDSKESKCMVMEMIQQLHTTAASSAGLERMFSTFGFVHSNIRNRLGAADKAAKLATIYKQLNR